jgi:phage baseplate assembly protein W|tara:strand:+ start:87 stop:503 length:417 start_codon:yes stop_codon:yes gene_type:complete
MAKIDVENRRSPAFKDISLTFTRHPVTDDIATFTNENAIKRAVSNLVRTRVGERFFESLLGSAVEDSLFEQADPDNAEVLEDDIRLLLENFEPRVANVGVSVVYPLDTNELLVQIAYDIVGLTVPRQDIEFVLQSTRI